MLGSSKKTPSHGILIIRTPKPETLNPKPKALNPEPQTLSPKPLGPGSLVRDESGAGIGGGLMEAVAHSLMTSLRRSLCMSGGDVAPGGEPREEEQSEGEG